MRSSSLSIECFCAIVSFQWSPLFLPINYEETQFTEDSRMFIFHQNHAELPIEFFCVTAGLQRSSYCVKPVEVRLAFFLYNTILLLTNCEVHTAKYSDRSFEVRTE